jgi:hypothetical protein
LIFLKIVPKTGIKVPDYYLTQERPTCGPNYEKKADLRPKDQLGLDAPDFLGEKSGK